MKYLVLMFLLMLSSCIQKKLTSDLMPLALDIADENYPTRKIDIHDIADVEYIPLESSDSTLLGTAYIYVSDKYIVTSDNPSGGNIYFFDHFGRLLWKFNKKGSGPGEFSFLNLEVVDFDTEECYVNDVNKKALYIYSFKGDYKRTMSLQGQGKGLESYASFSIRNYNKEYLLGYDDASVFFLRELPGKSTYYLINKKDGSRHPLSLKIRNGLTNHIYNGKGEYVGHLTHYPILQNGDECWISELSCDTVYSLVDNLLIPIAVQIPSIHSTNPPLAIFPYGFTDYFFVFNVVSLFTDENNPNRPYKEGRALVWNRLVNRLEEWELFNSDFLSIDNSMPVPVVHYGGVMKNCAIFFYGAGGLINCNKKGMLKGKLKEISLNLKEDDNNIVMLIKYNKEKVWKILTQ